MITFLVLTTSICAIGGWSIAMLADINEKEARDAIAWGDGEIIWDNEFGGHNCRCECGECEKTKYFLIGWKEMEKVLS